MECQLIEDRRAMRRIQQKRKRVRAVLLLLILLAAAVFFVVHKMGLEDEFVFLNTGNTKYYSQTDARWGQTLYGKSGTIAEAGCGPTCLAMVTSSLTDTIVTPLDTAAWAVSDGQRSEGNGSLHSIIMEGGNNYGFPVQGIGKDDGTKIKQALTQGKLVVALMGKGHFTTSGHFIVLRGMTDDGKILVSDPMSRKRSAKKWDLDLILKEARSGAASGGPFWICG